ncbi:MAG TPA: RNA chaperone Hfq [Burkholderiales bacterium]
MSESRSPLQDEYLASLRDNSTRVAIFLVNGIKLVGRIQSFDTYVVMLENSGTQLVFKHAISTVIPQEGAAAEERARQTRTGAEHTPPPRVRVASMK